MPVPFVAAIGAVVSSLLSWPLSSKLSVRLCFEVLLLFDRLMGIENRGGNDEGADAGEEGNAEVSGVGVSVG